MNRRLMRSRTNMMVAGVCGGLGEYLGIDPTFVRLFFVLLAMVGNGAGVILYFLLWIIMPPEGERRQPTFQETVRTGSEEIAERARAIGDDLRQMVQQPNPQAGLIIGIALVVLGGVYLVQNLRLPWLNWLDSDAVFGMLLVLGGVVLLIRTWRGGEK